MRPPVRTSESVCAVVSVTVRVCPSVPMPLCLPVYNSLGATRGVMDSMSAFLACHQCYCAGSSPVWGLNLRALVCGIF